MVTSDKILEAAAKEPADLLAMYVDALARIEGLEARLDYVCRLEAENQALREERDA